MFLKYSYVKEDGTVEIEDRQRVGSIVIAEDSLHDLLVRSIEEEEKNLPIDLDKFITAKEFFKRNKDFPVKEHSFSSFIYRCYTGSRYGWKSLKPFIAKRGCRNLIMEKEFIEEFQRLNKKHKRFG